MEDFITFDREYMKDITQLVNQSNYEAPSFKSEKNKEWVPYLDTDKTQFPDKLIYYKNNSALHGGILTNMIDQVAGESFKIDEKNPKYEETIQFLDRIDANLLRTRLANDLCIFKGVSFIAEWAKDGSKIINATHIDFSKIRSSKVDEKGKIPGYFYSWDWNTQRPKTIFIPAFDKNTMAEKRKEYEIAIEKSTLEGKIVPEINNIFSSPTEQIYYFHPYSSNEFYYPLPYYIAAINAINTDIITDQYGLSMMENGLSSNHIINFKGNYSAEQKKNEARKFDRTYIRGIKKNLPIITFSKDQESSIEITPIQSNGKDQKYTTINENVTQKILFGHGVTSPMLVGIKEAGSLGGSQEIDFASELFFKNTIRPKQKIIEAIFNEILFINDLAPITIKKLEIISTQDQLDK